MDFFCVNHKDLAKVSRLLVPRWVKNQDLDPGWVKNPDRSEIRIREEHPISYF
jgi:hypothetical protein